MDIPCTLKKAHNYILLALDNWQNRRFNSRILLLLIKNKVLECIIQWMLQFSITLKKNSF